MRSRAKFLSTATFNANVERSNLQPNNTTGVDQENQEPIAIPPIPPSFDVPPPTISEKDIDID